MHRPRSRRAAVALTGLLVVGLLTACSGGGGPTIITTANGVRIDVTAACAALAGLQHSADALQGVNVADPDTSLAALDRAVAAYGAALATFERVGPPSLRASTVAVRNAVIAHHFARAITERAAIDARAAQHCKP